MQNKVVKAALVPADGEPFKILVRPTKITPRAAVELDDSNPSAVLGFGACALSGFGVGFLLTVLVIALFHPFGL